MTMKTEGDMISKKKAAELLGVSVSSIDRLMKKKAIPYHKIGVAVRFAKTDIEAFKQKVRQEAQ
jgi:excisionase family DNA binding protein